MGKIARRYASTWLLIDLLSVAPIDWFALGPQLSGPHPNEELLKAFKPVMMVRLLRASRFRYFRRWEEPLAVATGADTNRFVKLLLAMAVFAHWNGCLQYLVAYLEGFPDDSWVVRSGLIEQEKAPFHRYSYAFTNAIGQMLALSIGILTPRRTSELWTCVVSIVIGAVLYAAFVASLTAVIAAAGASAREYQSKLDTVNQYMKNAALPRELRMKMRQYYALCYPNRRAFDEDRILSEISQPLTEDISLHKCAAVLRTLHVLSNKEAEVGLDRAISLALKRVAFVRGDCIIREGEPAVAMYFVLHGEVEVWRSTQLEGPITTLGKGSFFGEMALLSGARREKKLPVHKCGLIAT